MRLLVDGDSCPVLNIIEKTAEKLRIELVIYSDICHNINLNYGKMVKLDNRNQEVDMAIYNDCKENDIIITNDYGLAELILGKNAYVINHNGRQYTDKNIEQLLMKRHQHAKIIRSGGRHQTHKKRDHENDKIFKNKLLSLIQSIQE